MKFEKLSLQTQADAVLYFLRKLDVDMVNELLDEDKTYAELKKSVFISKLGIALDKFIEAGDESLIQYPGKCGSEECINSGCPGYTFLGNRSGLYLDLIVIEEEGRVIDIYDCTHLEAVTPKRKTTKRVKIDTSGLEF